MSPMILSCSACSAQNFLSDERIAAREVPPRCWKCFAELPPVESAAEGNESYNTFGTGETSGGLHDA